MYNFEDNNRINGLDETSSAPQKENSSFETVEIPTAPQTPAYYPEPKPLPSFAKPAKPQKHTHPWLIAAICLCCIFSMLLGTVGGALTSLILVRRVENDHTTALDELRSENQSTIDKILEAQDTLRNEIFNRGDSSEDSTPSGGAVLPSAEYLSAKDVAAKVQDTVVAINISITQNVSGFGQTDEYTTVGSGSGVIISDDGYIVTNNHVIENSDKITVILRDGTEYDATLVGTDDVVDIAVVKIDAQNLPYVTFGDSDTIQVGEPSIVIGNPLGEFGNSLTSGVISGLDREITIDDETMMLIQTDAAVNPGNSGGGMFNAKGELIGVVVAKSIGTDVEGIGFAIPCNDVSLVVADLIEYGYVTGRPQIGIEIVEINNAMTAMRYGVNRLGVYISNVEVDSAAYEAGLRIGDCIIAIDDEEFTTFTAMKQLLSRHSVGDTLSVTVIRYGESKPETVQVELIEKIPESFDSSAAA
ncbi:MAG: trypsin-like peptidase domain-containing protein [Oscillospiraceae bacterium]|nr:trypsin-like peptidase domain-containing protein [Oscillospiraceae bacterium]MBQ3048390.1 trypsin-like peptidase domain-containing protein [Oscillospiraceae bacterium]